MTFDILSRRPRKVYGRTTPRLVCAIHKRRRFAQSSNHPDHPTSQKLAALDPANAGWQDDLATTHNKLGRLAEKHCDAPRARHHRTEALAIYDGLTKLDPTNTDWRDQVASLRQLLGHGPARL